MKYYPILIALCVFIIIALEVYKDTHIAHPTQDCVVEEYHD